MLIPMLLSKTSHLWFGNQIRETPVYFRVDYLQAKGNQIAGVSNEFASNNFLYNLGQ